MNQSGRPEIIEVMFDRMYLLTYTRAIIIMRFKTNKLPTIDQTLLISCHFHAICFNTKNVNDA